MTGAPDILQTVGFEKTKVGSGDKEVGYKINEGSLTSLVGSVLICIGIMALLTLSMVYDVHFERKNVQRKIRSEEHHAATKLAQVHMELWNQYKDDISESREAQVLLKTLDQSYKDFQAKYRVVTQSTAAELNVNPDRANKFADKILHMVSDLQEANMKHAKRLLDHLVEAGKKGATLEKHVEREILEEVEAEGQKMAEDASAGINASAGETKDLLRPFLEGLFDTFHDYESEFGGKVRENFKKGGPVYDHLKELYARIIGADPPSEEDVIAELDKIDLKSVGAPLGQGRVLPVDDIVEELVLIPKIPHKEIEDLEKAWRAGAKDSIAVFTQLEEWHKAGQIPSGWLEGGARKDEKVEEAEEKDIEKKEASGVKA
mmetsp:Transcript_18099/g.52291  ORF Transcript_18099/g.52291 Transcript_18099/m.52291 type:complete len:375 (-) Transcript_18099:100-1224(-)|eukprot:CAMPEP_0176063104 /NCGR_PEP_ID=MMETSP0120_2-20121206/31471_1 /TAXON_ID=160619 /ORGANISM="Kryptoperidinium foliaceum, Strain CCMP 1326" /LENGTH=374 /DNA_ID=CAMNT_0017396675 /DNA_START=48 /DNA_END=1172 /DNA_ORIENTATION=+